MSTRSTILSVLAIALLAAACGKKDDKGGGTSADKPAAGDKAPSGDQPAAPAGGPFKITAKGLFADFAPNSGVDGMALMDKYHDGVSFTGTIKSVVTEESGDSSLVFDVDGKNIIMAGFTDKAALKAKAPKAGDSLAVTCKVGGESGAMLQVTDCALAK